MTMQLRSSAFDDGAAIPRRFTREGGDVSPPLNWSDPPAPTRSFVLLCDDPDAPAGTWHHWAAYDIPPTTREPCGRRRADHQNEAGGQRFSESGLWRSVSTSWPWASSLSLPAACPLDGPSSGKVQCVLP